MNINKIGKKTKWKSIPYAWHRVQPLVVVRSLSLSILHVSNKCLTNCQIKNSNRSMLAEIYVRFQQGNDALHFESLWHIHAHSKCDFKWLLITYIFKYCSFRPRNQIKCSNSYLCWICSNLRYHKQKAKQKNKTHRTELLNIFLWFSSTKQWTFS